MANMASCCAAVMSPSLTPLRWKIPVGKFDQRVRCASSVNAKLTAAFWVASSVARNACAAVTAAYVASPAGGGSTEPAPPVPLLAAVPVVLPLVVVVSPLLLLPPVLLLVVSLDEQATSTTRTAAGAPRRRNAIMIEAPGRTMGERASTRAFARRMPPDFHGRFAGRRRRRCPFGDHLYEERSPRDQRRGPAIPKVSGEARERRVE